MSTPWDNWEDYAAGLYLPRCAPEGIDAARRLLSDPDVFHETAAEMVREWVHAARHNLHHLWTGRNAWIGQASCLYAHGATSLETRQAWGSLSNERQHTANRVATIVREQWERGAINAQTQLAV